MGVTVGAGHQQVLLGLLLPRLRRLRSDLERSFVAADRVRPGEQGADAGVHAGEQPRGAGQQAVHVPDRRRRTGQGFEQCDDPVRGHKVDHHQVGGERGQTWPVPGRAGPGGPGGPVRGAHTSAPAAHLVQVVLGDRDHHRRDLVFLVAVDHTQIGRPGQARAAPATTGREQLPPLVRRVGELQPGTGRAGLLTPRPHRPTPRSHRLLRRRRLTRIVITRRRAGGVTRVPRQQVLHPRQLRRQRLVRRPQLLDLLPLGPHHDEQLVTGHLLERGHPKIKPHPGRSPDQRHARTGGQHEHTLKIN